MLQVDTEVSGEVKVELCCPCVSVVPLRSFLWFLYSSAAPESPA